MILNANSGILSSLETGSIYVLEPWPDISIHHAQPNYDIVLVVELFLHCGLTAAQTDIFHRDWTEIGEC